VPGRQGHAAQLAAHGLAQGYLIDLLLAADDRGVEVDDFLVGVLGRGRCSRCSGGAVVVLGFWSLHGVVLLGSGKAGMYAGGGG
jgi:hypothetical protein